MRLGFKNGLAIKGDHDQRNPTRRRVYDAWVCQHVSVTSIQADPETAKGGMRSDGRRGRLRND